MRQRRVGLAPQWQVLSLCLDEAQVTVTQKSVSPGRARYKPSNHCAGNADALASPVVTLLVCFSSLHTGLWVRPSTRCSLRPLPFGRRYRCKDSDLTVARTRCHVRQAWRKKSDRIRLSIERLVVVSVGWRRQRTDVAAAGILLRACVLAAQCGFPGTDQRAAEKIVHRKDRPFRH